MLLPCTLTRMPECPVVVTQEKLSRLSGRTPKEYVVVAIVIYISCRKLSSQFRKLRKQKPLHFVIDKRIFLVPKIQTRRGSDVCQYRLVWNAACSWLHIACNLFDNDQLIWCHLFLNRQRPIRPVYPYLTDHIRLSEPNGEYRINTGEITALGVNFLKNFLSGGNN